MKLASVGTLGLLVLKVGQGVANTVAVVVTVGTAGLIGVPGHNLYMDVRGGLTLPEGVRVGGQDVRYQNWTRADHFSRLLFLVIVVI